MIKFIDEDRAYFYDGGYYINLKEIKNRKLFVLQSLLY